MSQRISIEMDLPGVVLSTLEGGGAARREELTIDLGQGRLVQTALNALTDDDRAGIAAAVSDALQDYLLTLHTSPGTLIPKTLITEADFEALEDVDPDRLYLVYRESADGVSELSDA